MRDYSVAPPRYTAAPTVASWRQYSRTRFGATIAVVPMGEPYLRALQGTGRGDNDDRVHRQFVGYTRTVGGIPCLIKYVF